MAFRFRDDLSTADVGFEADGPTLEAVFHAAAEALLAIAVADPAAVRPCHPTEVQVESESIEMLLFDFLQELVFLKDTQALLLHPERIRITPTAPSPCLVATMDGEKVDPARHALAVDVKAVTLHRFGLERTAEGWRAQVVVDV